MTLWIKLGVRGNLSNPAQKCLGRITSLYASIGEDLFITSIREGNHGAGSLHYIGDAFDFRYPKSLPIALGDIKTVAGKDFDIVAEEDHIHCEYDPKT